MMQDQQKAIAAITKHRDMLRGKPYNRRRRDMQLAQIGLIILGLALIGLWWLTNDWSTMSMMFILLGVTLLAIAVMLYMFFPGRYLHSDVYGAMCITDVQTISKVLSSMLISSRGIYIPAKQAGSTRLFLPLPDTVVNQELSALASADQSIFSVSGKALKGVVIDPPGQGLFHHAYSIGAFFMPDQLENEVRDVIENGMELATRVSLKVENGVVSVKLEDIACQNMCEAIRKKNPSICSQIGCPVCSFVGCMIADGTGKMARMENVEVTGKIINLRFELIDFK